ncbi:cell division protein ZapB [Alteribacter populi]|uniref:cell division protein ZapB n=1 Tax=Alteribacter populi TaxID=2011011 RepID=UPI000BBA6F7A|nr:cell division protein ZapB [Alteribacter populi]
MESNLLSLAQKYQREHEWRKAIDCYKQYINEKTGVCEDTVYAAYARSLRIIGQTSLAKATLVEAKKQHPHSETILLEFHNLYDFLGDWNAAKTVANSLIKMSPKKADYHLRLGRTYSFLSEYKKAKKAYRTALELKHQLPLDSLIENIQRSFAENPNEVSSKYIFIDGKNNLGAFVHDHGDKKYFTKISLYKNKSTGAGREETFYKNLCADFPQLKSLVPQYVDSQIIDQISYLTIEMIDSLPITSEHLQKVIETSQQVSTVKYREVIDSYPIPNYVFQYKKGRAISVVHFFTHIHKEAYNQKIFESLHLITKNHNYPKAVIQIIHRLEAVIMNNQLYKYMVPDKHYSLLHGDFAFQNQMINKADETPRIIDWTSYTVGPHFIDIARYMTSLLIPYPKVKNCYLDDHDTGGKLTNIEEIFFLYALILFYFQKFGRKRIETEVSNFLLPALEDLEKLVLKMNTSIEGDHLSEEKQRLTEEMKEKELKINQLEQRLTIVKEEKEHLKKRLKNVLSSKSWKITRPLRIFTERLKKNG